MGVPRQMRSQRQLGSEGNKFVMKYRSVHINKDGYYSIGIDEETGPYVLEVVMTWVAWYSRYFRLSKEEFDSYPKNQAEIDLLARACAGDSGIKNNQDRFIYSEKSQENQ